MIHLCFFAVALLCAASIIAPVWADEVKVRTGKHPTYSRLVFDWESRINYTLERPADNRLIIAFEESADLDASAAQANPVANISGLKVLGTDPLRVEITIPADSRTRDLRAGNKIVVDVYNPPGGAAETKPLNVAKADPKPEAKPEPTPEPEPQPVEETKAEEEPAPPQEELKPAEPETETAATEEADENVEIKMRDEVSMATISSTKNFGMAIFELAGRIWMVNDKSDTLLKPQLSGPLAEKLEPLNPIDSAQGKAYTITAQDDQETKALGGGILWRVMVGQDLGEADYKDPVRADVNREEDRSGKLMWPLRNARSVFDLQDPLTGRMIKVVTVDDADEAAGPAREFVDFEVLTSYAGLAISPKVSDLDVQIVRGGVEISRPEGLTMVDEALLASMTTKKRKLDDSETGGGQKIFDFKGWQLGGVPSAPDNKRIILASLKDQPDTARSESLLTLGKMYTANAMGPEALGVLNYALIERPGLWDNPEFTAIYAVASTLARRHEDAFRYLSNPILEPFEEIQYWRAAVLANEGDWQQAYAVLPKSVGPLLDYTELLQNRLIPDLAEIALRAGDLRQAEKLITIAKSNESIMDSQQAAGFIYLKGEAARQMGKEEETKELWRPLTTGPDDLYRAKAGLALTRMEMESGDITTEEGIDRLERLRYAWRGDQLEVQIYYWLGRIYFEQGEYIKGLKIMREAISYDPGTALGQRIAGEMADLFADLFLSEQLDEVNPLDAVGLYDEFKELVPLDERGNQIIERLAEHLVTADLLTRAGDLLKYQTDHRLQGSEIYRVSVRLAAIRLIDSMPDKAIAALNRAASQLEQLPEEMKTASRYREISMLRARALSRKGRPDQALALLNDLERTPDMNLLRADIAWTAGYWDDAAEALEDVITDRNISLTRPLDDENTALLLQRAIALSLASDRIALANIREKYTDLMNQTSKAKTFEVITRPRRSGALADRDTLLSVVSEVDLFKEFLDAYKNTPRPVNYYNRQSSLFPDKA
ncbi:MAG: hypothetical protein AAF204_01650 [Pseudomonadota bacterium]